MRNLLTLLMTTMLILPTMTMALEEIVEPGTAPKGKPFVTINGAIVEVQNDLQDLRDDLDLAILDIATVEGQIAYLEGVVADLGVDVEANADLIAALEVDIANLNIALDTKQNIVTGTCPAGQAMVSINAGVNDGYVVCADVGSTLDMTTVYGFAFAPATGKPTGTVYCPAGYQVTGGGGTWSAGLRQSEPISNVGWRVAGVAGTGSGFVVMVINARCIR